MARSPSVCGRPNALGGNTPCSCARLAPEAAGDEIKQADADDVEGRPDRTHDQVLERGQQRTP
jgi:hypothetical protein